MKNCTCFWSRFCLLVMVLAVSGGAFCTVAASAAAHHANTLTAIPAAP